MKTFNEVAKQALLYAEAVRWLESCPLPDGQPFYETAFEHLEDLTDEMRADLEELGRPDLAQRILTQIEEQDADFNDAEWFEALAAELNKLWGPASRI